MSETEKFQAAKLYIDKQLQTMKDHGCAPTKLTGSQYDTMVKQAAQTINR